MKLPYHVKSVAIYRGHVFPELYPCDCHGIGCESFLDDIAEYVLAGGVTVDRPRES